MSIRVRNLSPARRALVELIVSTHYGYLENLLVNAGQPVVGPPLRVVRDIKLGQRDRRQWIGSLDPFLEREQFIELFDLLDSVGDGVINRVEVQAGLPFKISLEQAVV